MSFDETFRQICERENQPHPPSAVANYVATRKAGRTLYVSGQAPFVGADIPPRYIGRLGEAITTEVGAEAARITGLNLLYDVQDALGTLDRVDCILAVDGMVNCVPAYTNQPKVIDGCSDLMVEIFGDRGKHTRSAVGQVSLAFDICVEIKLLVRIAK
ncbi:MAG: RidA family protein [Longimicrobiales bacterium]